MKRAILCYLLIFISVAVNGIAYGQDDAGSDAGGSCSFNIVGLWKTSSTSVTYPIFYDFSPEGRVTVMGHTEDTLPKDFEMISSMKYSLDDPTAPKVMEFTVTTGNTGFPGGITAMDITELREDSFTTEDPVSGRQIKWTRAQTHRYFLTFAARSGPPELGGPAFAMWTTLDGRDTKIEALGVQLIKDKQGQTVPVFGSIPEELYQGFKSESQKKSETMIRLELTRAEFERSHKVFEKWDEDTRIPALPSSNPYLNGMEFLGRAAESLNECVEKVKLPKIDGSTSGDAVAKTDPAHRSLEYVRVLRKMNEVLHVTDGKFPMRWRPALLSQSQ
jgi:hypothetical protein